MKTDTYTKVILTVIAFVLTVNMIKDFDIIPQAYANSNTSFPETSTEYKLVPVGNLETLDVRIVDINTYNELNVNIKSIDSYDELKVNLTNIDTTDELDVNLDEVGGGWVSHGGPIPVKVE